MGDREVELSDQQILLPNADAVENSFQDYFLESNTTAACTHAHMCNPPGPDDAAHNHTCFHMHTQVMAMEEEDNHYCVLRSKKRPPGNCEAVRKYREKKKAHTANLEKEVNKLRVLNQQLARRLQCRVVLEAEVMRLRDLLVDLTERVKDEFGKKCDGNLVCEANNGES